MIKLTGLDGKEFWINHEIMTGMMVVEGVLTIELFGVRTVGVRETPDIIFMKIKVAKIHGHA